MDGSAMRVYLIGLPGCGKSTLGKELATKLDYEFIDLDLYIEQKACMFIDELFEAYGETYFRQLEANTLEELQQKDQVIIATGGGVISKKENKKLMTGPCIYLNAPLETIEQRLMESSIIRPLLQKKTLLDLYNERKEKYQYFMDFEVENVDIQKSVDEIVKWLGENL